MSDQNWVFVNDEFCKLEDAKVSVLDHGFLYGDGIFETMLTVNSKIFRVDEHINRLFSSAHAIGLKIPYAKEGIKTIMSDTLSRNNRREGYVRLIVTRGEGFPILDPRVPNRSTVVVMITPRELPTVVSTTYKTKGEGIRTIFASTRKTPPICSESRVKSLNYLNNILARIEAINAGVDEAILLDCKDFVAEAPGANVSVVRNGTIHSPELSNQLEGITAKVVLDLARKRRYPTERTNMTRYDVYTADEVFLTSTTPGITPVAEVDGRAVGSRMPGPVTEELSCALRDLIISECPP